MVSPDTRKTFGMAVRASRVDQGMTLAELSEATFGNAERKGFLSQVELGRRGITPLTAGKIAQALQLDDKELAPMLDNREPVDESPTPQDALAAQMAEAAVAKSGPDIGETLLMALAYRYAETDPTDPKAAYQGLEAALNAAEKLKAQAALKSNVSDAVDQVLDEVQALNAAGQLDEAAAAVDRALADEAEGSKRRTLRLLEVGLEQDVLRGDAESAAGREIARVGLDHEYPCGQLSALFVVAEKRLEEGRNQGRAFDLRLASCLFRYCSDLAVDQSDKAAALGNAANCVQFLGMREVGPDRLIEAIELYRRLLAKTSRKAQPAFWARQQNNLGATLQALGQREVGTVRLKESVEAYRAALEERTREWAPMDWAATQDNLGNVLQVIGEREGNIVRLEEAVAARRAALEVRTRDRVPMDWAITQNNLGTALHLLGEQEGDAVRMVEAVAVHRAALEERTRDRVPLGWAETQSNLGASLLSLGMREGNEARLEEAVMAYRAALEELTIDRVPMGWAATQLNLAILYMNWFDLGGEVARLDRAMEHAENAREVFVKAQADHYIASADAVFKEIQSRRDEI